MTHSITSRINSTIIKFKAVSLLITLLAREIRTTLHHLQPAMEIGFSRDHKENDRPLRIRTCHLQRTSKSLIPISSQHKCYLSVRSSHHPHVDSNLIHKQVPQMTSNKSTFNVKSIRTVWPQEMPILNRINSNLTCLTPLLPHHCHISLQRQLLKMIRERVEGRIKI